MRWVFFKGEEEGESHYLAFSRQLINFFFSFRDFLQTIVSQLRVTWQKYGIPDPYQDYRSVQLDVCYI